MAEPEKKTELEPEPVEVLEDPSEGDNPPSLEVDPNVTEPGTRLPHPLAPGGKRFEQIYAQSKQAQRENTELKDRLSAAEARIAALANPNQNATKSEYSWAELETLISQGRITRADAEAHREDIRTKQIAKQVREEFRNETRTETREQQLDASMGDYFRAVPAALVETSPERARLEEEFDFLASINGVDSNKVEGVQRKALQLNALRNVFGTLDSLKTRTAPTKTETHQGLSGGTPPSRSVSKDQAILNALSKAQVAHYKKMMSAGRYKNGWADVVKEIKWEKPKGRS